MIGWISPTPNAPIEIVGAWRMWLHLYFRVPHCTAVVGVESSVQGTFYIVLSGTTCLAGAVEGLATGIRIAADDDGIVEVVGLGTDFLVAGRSMRGLTPDELERWTADGPSAASASNS